VEKCSISTGGRNTPIDPVSVKKFQQNKAQLHEHIVELKQGVEKLKIERKKTPKHIKATELPDSELITRLNKDSKQFIDTIKMIAYRAETAMAYAVKEHLSRDNDARSFIRAIYKTEADIIPDKPKQILKKWRNSIIPRLVRRIGSRFQFMVTKQLRSV
jgi:hypothetical protein